MWLQAGDSLHNELHNRIGFDLGIEADKLRNESIARPEDRAGKDCGEVHGISDVDAVDGPEEENCHKSLPTLRFHEALQLFCDLFHPGKYSEKHYCCLLIQQQKMLAIWSFDPNR